MLHAVNSLTFAGINICIFETKRCLRGLIFAVRPGLINYLGTGIVFADIYFAI